MPKDFLAGVADYYDVVVIGSGLAGMTAANTLARAGRSVLLLEQHYKLGGMATWFRRPQGHIFDISLHGFPVGMVKSCRRYWSAEIADSIVQLEKIRFDNPMFSLTTTFNREDFTRLLVEKFAVPAEQVQAFFDTARGMNFYDDQATTVGQLFERFFPGREDVIRLLMEPITYANGSTLEDPAISYGIVFSNFMSKGVFIFHGGTDTLIRKMTEEMKRNGVDIRRNCLVEKIIVEKDLDGRPRVKGVSVKHTRDGELREIVCTAVLSNANIKNTLLNLVGAENLPATYADETRAVRVNTSSCQVYMGVKEGLDIPFIGDLVFTSGAKKFTSEELVDLHTTSRTYSLYYPDMRPHTKVPHYGIVTSLNQKWDSWAHMDESTYATHKARLIEESFVGLEKYIPDIRKRVDFTEAATPRTVERYVTHWQGTSFGTKFEGLKVSMEMPDHIAGLYHAGSVGIIMSGWLGTINYGIITSAKVDAYVRNPYGAPADVNARPSGV